MLPILAIVFSLLTPVEQKPQQNTPYCQIGIHFGYIDPDTKQLIHGWTQGYGPCTQLDRYEIA